MKLNLINFNTILQNPWRRSVLCRQRFEVLVQGVVTSEEVLCIIEALKAHDKLGNLSRVPSVGIQASEPQKPDVKILIED